MGVSFDMFLKTYFFTDDVPTIQFWEKPFRDVILSSYNIYILHFNITTFPFSIFFWRLHENRDSHFFALFKEAIAKINFDKNISIA